MTTATAKSDFAAAEEIKAILTGRDKTEQERIIRWVNESLGLTTISSPAFHPAPPVSISQPPSPGAPPVSAVKNIRSYVAEKKPKSDLQFAAVAAYFYRFEAPEAERKETIKASDLNEAGRLARGYGFKNAINTLHNCLKQGYFDSAGHGSFRINAVGENLVAMALPGSGVDSSQSPMNGRRLSKPKKKPARKAKAS